MNHSNLKKPLVLIVDDAAKNLQVLGTILKEEPVDIAAAMNGKQALAVIEKTRPDLILLDIMMPELDGFATMKQLKSNQDTAEIPVIFLTARTEMEDIVKGLKLGAVDYITKPFNSTELLARVRNHLELKRSRDALQEANAAKDKFFSIISHDLRTPFAIIIGFAEYLIDHFGKINEKKSLELYQDILSISRRSHQLFENLLQWARSQAGSIPFRPETLQMKTVVNETVGLLKDRAREKGIRLITDVPEDLIVRADKNMLDTILRNLTGNAIKFTRAGGRVEVTMRKRNSGYQICVADDGVGIPKPIQDKLFRISEHVSTHGTEQEEGAGLGLILVKEFTEKHGGRIEIESEEGKGSKFILNFLLN
jgi:two-component system sensor histidine kinase/response regulator